MAEKDAVVQGYAEAILTVAEAEGVLETVEDELFRFAKVVEKQGKLRDALTDPGLPFERKRAVLHDLLGERASPHTLNLLGFLIEQGRARELGRIIQGVAEEAARRRERALAEVRTAVPLTATQRNRLREALSKASGRDVELKVLVDPSVVGGVEARVGEQVFDGTVRSRLRAAKERLGSM